MAHPVLRHPITSQAALLTPIPLTDALPRCSTCSLGQLCLPVGMSRQDIEKMDTLVQDRVRVHKGETLYRLGDPLTAVYEVRFGTLKTHLTMEDGRSQVAGFLINLSERLAVRGYSASEFVLRMSREEIGSYLGLKLETVSRLFSRFAEAGLIQVRQRHVKLVDMAGLRQLLTKSC